MSIPLATISTTLKKGLHNSKIKTNPKRKTKKNKTLPAILKRFDAIVMISKTSSSITLFPTSFGLIVITVSSFFACRLTISNKMKYEVVMQK